jgi:hypothetical protein
VSGLPDLVELEPSLIAKYQGYRRPGPAFEGIAAIRATLVRTLKEAQELPTTFVQLYAFAEKVLSESEFFFFKTFVTSHQPHEANRWLGAILADSGRYVSFEVGGKLAMMPISKEMAAKLPGDG